MIRLIRAVFGVSAIFLSVDAISHHSTQVFYDYDDVIEVQGRVTWVLWRNPHVRFNLTSTDSSGNEVVWELEGGSLNSLQRASVSEGAIKVGDIILAAGPRSSRGLNTIYVSNVLLPDGQEVSLRREQHLRWTTASSVSSNEERSEPLTTTSPQAGSIFRVWTREYGDRPAALPFTSAALERAQSWDPLTEDPAVRCIPQGMPGAMDNPYPIEFVQQGENIVLRLEEWDGIRTIHMGAEILASDLIAPHMGYSTGHWEEDVLVVETSSIDYPLFGPSGIPQSEEVGIVERFQLSDDGERLDYQVTVTDPGTFVQPAVLYQHWVWVPSEEIKPYECTLGEA
ncbi:MAG: DUF6152 family protein [Pseudomonadota bacterium]|nr:DUF6152 family protein [Pseudomonadota bacterium]